LTRRGVLGKRALVKSNRTRLISLLSILFTMALVGCSSKSSDSAGDQGQDVADDPHALYSADLNALANVDSSQSAIMDYDMRNDRLFSKIFGGTSFYDVSRYYNDRIKYAVTMDEFSHLQSSTTLPDQGWLKSSHDRDNGGDSGNSQLGAVNVGTLLWLESVVANTPLSVFIDNDWRSIESTRAGIMMFGPAYKSRIYDSYGDAHILPPAYRQSILMHEARHADCTGGLSQKTLQIMRNAQSAEEFTQKVPFMRCGHLHVVCKSGELAGIPACDAERFGAYKVGAVFIAGILDAETDYVSRKILEMVELDYETRQQESYDLAGFGRDPDMTSAGLVQ
jgi:hypothetical protein